MNLGLIAALLVAGLITLGRGREAPLPYPYLCRVHGLMGMIGTVIVNPASQPGRQ